MENEEQTSDLDDSKGLANSSENNKPPDIDIVKIVESAFSALNNRINALSDLMENRLSYDKTKEVAFDRLYAELDELKSNRIQDYLRPLYMDLILLLDRIDITKKSATEDSTFFDFLASIEEEILEILIRRDVEVIRCTDAKFNRKLQQVVEVLETNNEMENNQVAHVIRRGFKCKERILRPEEVAVHKLSKTPQKSSNGSTLNKNDDSV